MSTQDPNPETARSAGSGRPLQLLLLAVALGASALLVGEHFGAVGLPGCGPESACARAAASALGKLPGVGWPVSFVGAAWFGGLLAWRLFARGPAPGLVRLGVRLSVVASVGYVVAMATGGYLCPYCLAVHAANLGFWIALERGGRAAGAAPAPPVPIGAAVAVALAVTLALGVADARAQQRFADEQEAELAASTAAILDAASDAEAGETPAAGPRPGVDDGGGADPDRPAFTGRWPQGPQEAAVRVVVFSDYQCPDCRRVEYQLREIEKQDASVSLSMKHYPMCKDCNPHTRGQNPHPNACWAARAAEAAGMLGGGEGFHAMHRWLFQVKGDFTRPVLEAQVASLGFDPDEFRRTMEGPETLARVRADIEEGRALGIHFTPMVFINGVELRGVFADNAVRRAIEEVLASGPEPATAERDRPAFALEKYVGDWREGDRHVVPDGNPRWFGDPEAPLEIVVWGDHRDDGTAELDGLVRAWVGEHGGARYNYRHFPFETGCNPFVKGDGHPRACRAARAAEAAFLLGGIDAYWGMHVWLLEHVDDELSDATLSAVARDLGLEPDTLFQTMRSPVEPAIIEDVRAGGNRLYRGRIPTLYVDGRVVPRWNADGQDVLGATLDAAAAER